LGGALWTGVEAQLVAESHGHRARQAKPYEQPCLAMDRLRRIAADRAAQWLAFAHALPRPARLDACRLVTLVLLCIVSQDFACLAFDIVCLCMTAA
jgi:hypothetical protein